MTDWVRLWHDMPTDPKWRVIARKSGQPLATVIATFTMLMVEASRAADRGSVAGFRCEEAAAALDVDDADVSSIIDAMQGRVIIEARLSGWDRRQPKREDDGAAARKAAWKERKGTQRNAKERSGTQGNAPDTETDTDTEEPEATASGPTAPVADPSSPAIDFCKAVFDSGRAILTVSGLDARKAGSLIGRWRQSLGDAEILTLIRQAEADGVSDPAAWLTAAVETRNGNRPRRPVDGQAGIRGSRPDPALDLLRAARAAEAEESSARHRPDYRGTGLALPPVYSG